MIYWILNAPIQKHKYLAACLVFFFISACRQTPAPPENEESADHLFAPDDWLFRQRAFPNGTINHSLYLEAMRQWRALSQTNSGRVDQPWIPVGPFNIGGRIVDIEAHPQNRDEIYIGSASGGIFKTYNGGASWAPVFDEALTLSIGDLAIAPSSPQTVYAGTGEANAGGGSLAYDGAGVYKTTNGGASWSELGLYDCGSIGKVLVHPENPDKVYVAAMGHLFANNAQRGVFKSTDGGENWVQSLFISDSTGVIDMAMDPLHPDTLYAAAWERIRRVNRRQYAGVTSGIYRSFNGGETWTRLSNGLPAGKLGRIGLAVSPANPAVIYAYIVSEAGNFAYIYRSDNRGNSWTQYTTPPYTGTPPTWWWFGKIFADPVNANKIYSMGLLPYRSVDAGAQWDLVFPGVHVDQHALFIDPEDPDFLLLGNDGGLYRSEDGGSSWFHFKNIPNIQFYTSEVDYLAPHRYYGGTQDNGTLRTLSGNQDDWEEILGGDGFVVLVDPVNNQYVYAESQYGNIARSADGGNNFVSATVGSNLSEPRNWKTPVALDPSNPSRVYFGSNRIYRSTNRAQIWTAISPVLIAPPPNPNANLVYGTFTTLAVAASDGNVIYAGADDGHVWKTSNGGGNWTDISAGLPQRWVTSLTVDPFDAAKVYITQSGYRWNEYEPHVMRSDDGGMTWTDIGAGLPEVPVNDLVIDTTYGRLIVATDAGVYSTTDAGSSWQLLGSSMPRVVVTDLTLHYPTKKLIAATYGRSMYTLQLQEPVGTRNPLNGIRALAAAPNPFRSTTSIRFELLTGEVVNLSVFDLSGKKIADLFNGKLPAGSHEFPFSPGENSQNSFVVRLSAGSWQKSLLLLR